MAKANLKLRDGTTVTIEGKPEEVAAVLERFSLEGPPDEGKAKRRPRRGRGSRSRQKMPKTDSPRRTSKGPVDYIRELIAEDFFKDKRGLSDVRIKLEERAHVYPNTSLSPVLFRMVRERELRRIKEERKWKYVNP
jgi:hypothetical protein